MEQNKYKHMRPGGIELTKQLLQRANIKKGYLLDIGCGNGLTATYLAKIGYHVIAIDREPQTFRTNSNIQFIPMDAHEISTLKYNFNGILCECLLSLCECKKILKDASHILSDNGKVLIHDLYSFQTNSVIPTKQSWKEILNNNFKIEYFNDETELLSEYVRDCIWNEKKIDCMPKGISMKNIGYFSAIAKKSNI